MNKSWQIPRRTFLRGMGTAIALPLLESMVPAARALTAAGAPGVAPGTGLPTRMAFVYVPNGKNMSHWTPATLGENYDLPSTLEPLAAHRHDLSVISGLAHKKAFGNGDGGGDHARASATYLTGMQAKKSASDIRIGVSVDQVAANAIGDATRFPSLELSCDRGQVAGSCDSGYSCAYQFNIAWRSETQPMNPEIDPKAAFDRLFGGGTPGESLEARMRRDRHNKSVLDFVMDQTKSLQTSLGTTDRRKLDEYLTAIRDVERRIEKNGMTPPELPAGVVPDFESDYSFQGHMHLMFDIITLAFQTDSTRVATFLLAHDGGNRPYPWIGVNRGHHSTSHHRNSADYLNELAKIDRWHVEQFAYFLEKLKSVKEGEGNLLDNSMIMYGAGISDGNSHSHDDLPTLLAGRAGGTIRPGRHIQVNDEPMTNLYVSMLNRMGVQADSFGDSAGKLEVIA